MIFFNLSFRYLFIVFFFYSLADSCRTYNFVRPTISLPHIFYCNVKPIHQDNPIQGNQDQDNNLNYPAVVFAVDYCYFVFSSGEIYFINHNFCCILLFYHRCHPNFLIGYFRPLQSYHLF